MLKVWGSRLFRPFHLSPFCPTILEPHLSKKGQSFAIAAFREGRHETVQNAQNDTLCKSILYLYE